MKLKPSRLPYVALVVGLSAIVRNAWVYVIGFQILIIQ